MIRIRFLLDEHINPRLRRALRQRTAELVIWCIGDVGAPALGTLDPEILAWCEDSGFVLVTNNRASMPRHLANHLGSGRHVPGIIVLNPHWGLGETVDELMLIWEVSSPDEYLDQIRYLPI